MDRRVSWRQNFSSMKSLKKAFGDVGDRELALVREICRGEVAVCEVMGLVREYDLPDYVEKYDLPDVALHVIDKLLGGFGVEAVGGDMEVSSYSPDMAYVNTGDTYSPTVVYDYGSGRFSLTSWGDWVERAGL